MKRFKENPYYFFSKSYHTFTSYSAVVLKYLLVYSKYIYKYVKHTLASPVTCPLRACEYNLCPSGTNVNENS